MRWIIAAFVSFLAVSTAGAFEIPTLDGRVTDKANLLTPAQVTSLTERIRGIEDKNGDGAQVALVTLNSLDGESIDKVKNEILRAWKLGAKGKDNGVLLVAAPNERKVGIEVAYGLEGAIPDSLASRIIAEQMRPHLKRGADNWFAAFDGAIAAIGAAVPDKMAAGVERRAGGGIGFFIICVLAVVSSICCLLWFVGRSVNRKKAADERAAQRAREARLYQDSLRTRSAPKFQPTFSDPIYRAGPPRATRASAAVAGAAAGASAASTKRAASEPSRSSRSDDSYSSSSWGGSNSSSSSSYDSGSSYSGGGGDSGGGGSSSDV